MSVVAIIILVGIVLIGVIGFTGKREGSGMLGWLVGGRKVPRWTSWFLQAGESLTTFSFLGLAGIAFAGGVSATFAVGYLTASMIGMFFVSPRIRDLAAKRGYLTMSDFIRDRFKSRTLSVVIAIVASLFLIPYLQLQLTGLGLIVELATGSSAARGFSMVLGSVLVIAFVIWAGLRGIARVSIFKDIGMLLALAIVAIFVVGTFASQPGLFVEVAKVDQTLLTTHAPGFDWIWWVSGISVTIIGSAFNTFPHLWSPVLAAESGTVLRSNYKWLAVYQLLLFLPITVGMAAVLIISPDTKGNRVLFTVSQAVMPEWLVGVIAVFGASAAMVPAGAIAMGISSLISNNVLFALPERVRFRLNHVIVAIALGLALLFGFVFSDIGALLLLTYGGLAQLAPAIAFGLGERVRVTTAAVTGGIVAGVLTVAIITFANIGIGTWDSGFIALAPNLIVFAIIEGVMRATGRGRTIDPDVEPELEAELATGAAK